MKKISIYIHWPYCEKKCPYCDFNSHVTATTIEESLYAKLYVKAIEYYKPLLQNREIQTIFFGGGTPSLAPPSVFYAIIDYIKTTFKCANSLEITMEANPNSTDISKMRQFKEAGINRASVGVQSFSDDHLSFLGRTHDKLCAINAIEVVQNIYDRFSFDLIYALPNQTLSQWKQELQQALQFDAAHMSLYQLTIEENTKFHNLYKKGKLQTLNTDLAADMYEMTNDIMMQHNIPQYEISNYAKIGQECIHNLRYWHCDDFIGIGPGAHGRFDFDYAEWQNFQHILQHPKAQNLNLELADAVYHKNHTENLKQIARISTIESRLPKQWLDDVSNHGTGINSIDTLTLHDKIEERIMMGMRTKSGISISQNCIAPSMVDVLCDMGLLIRTEDTIRTTDRGSLLLNQIIYKLISSVTI